MKRFLLLTAAASLLLFFACKSNNGDSDSSVVAPSAPPTDYTKVAVPEFSADSAYAFVEKQLSFGNRIPGSKGWERCAAWLAAQMGRWCDTVIVQEFPATLWDGTRVRGKNIIASLEGHPGSPAGKRILLGAHWDSRLWADHDPDEANHRKPLPGANDGASGVAVLMEMARAMAQMRPGVAVDFVFFDVEDQGIPEWAGRYEDDTWCKGSQHWSQHPHTPYYTAVYGVLLDMVGTQQPRYTKEQVSMRYAPGITNKLWTAAAALGYGQVFVNRETDPILDDHLYVNQMAGIPMVDIVQNNVGVSFFPHWHTLQDDMSHVDRNSLRMVGNVLLKTIYGDYQAMPGDTLADAK